ncbi:hypothetical protein QHF83_48435 [Polyangium sp. 15x6]|nr:hypothetical protein [Polyangium sp. 15x6]
MSNDKAKPPEKTTIRGHLATETSAMAAHALSYGQKVPSSALRVLSAIEEGHAGCTIEELADAHEQLAQVIAPMTPAAALALTDGESVEARRKQGYAFMTRRLMMVAIASLVAFVGLSLTPYTNDPQYENIFEASGLPLLINELFFISAAALGACFAGLAQLERNANYGTFDPRHDGAFWKRFMLGVISGLLLATILDLRSAGTPNPEDGNPIAAAGLALVGGFSCTVVYRILNRLVETLETAVRGGGEEVALAGQQASQARSGAQILKERMKMATKLAQVQRDLSAGVDPGVIQAQVDAMARDLLQEDTPKRGEAKEKAQPDVPEAPEA